MQNGNVFIKKILGFTLILYVLMTWVGMAPMSLAEGLVLGTLLALSLAGGVNWKWAKLPLVKSYLRAADALMLASVLSLLVLRMFPLEWGGKKVELNWMHDGLKIFYFYLPIFLAVAIGQFSKAERARGLVVAAIGFIALSLIGIQQFYTGWPIPHEIPEVAGRFHAIGFLGHHLSLASIWIFPTFLFLDLALNEKKQRALWGMAAGLGFVCTILSHSRMVWIALLVACALYFLIRIKNLKWKVASVAGLLILAGGFYFTPQVQTRVQQKMGVADRFEIWNTHYRLFQQRPLVGVGFRKGEESSSLMLTHEKPGQAVFSGHAHNNVIDMLSNIGVLGLMAWLFWCFWVFRVLWQNRRLSGLTGLFCAWVAFHINGFTQVNFWDGKVLHQISLMLAFVLVAVITKGENEKSTS